jgi:hypothetical protein
LLKPFLSPGLHQIVHGLQRERVERILLERRREDDGGRVRGGHSCRDFDPIQRWHMDVEKDQVGRELLDRFDRGPASRTFADDLHIRLAPQRQPDAISGNRLVVDDEYSHT